MYLHGVDKDNLTFTRTVIKEPLMHLGRQTKLVSAAARWPDLSDAGGRTVNSGLRCCWLCGNRCGRGGNRTVRAMISECCDAQVWWHWRDCLINQTAVLRTHKATTWPSVTAATFCNPEPFVCPRHSQSSSWDLRILRRWISTLKLFWDLTPCSLEDGNVLRPSSGGGSTLLWSVVTWLPNFTVSHTWSFKS